MSDRFKFGHWRRRPISGSNEGARRVVLVGRNPPNPCVPSLHRLCRRKSGSWELRRHALSCLLLLALLVTASPVAAKKRVRDLFGLKIGMSEESVHKKLKKIAIQQKEEKEKEEEGEHEVWSLKNLAQSRKVDCVINLCNYANSNLFLCAFASLRDI